MFIIENLESTEKIPAQEFISTSLKTIIFNISLHCFVLNSCIYSISSSKKVFVIVTFLNNIIGGQHLLYLLFPLFKRQLKPQERGPFIHVGYISCWIYWKTQVCVTSWLGRYLLSKILEVNLQVLTASLSSVFQCTIVIYWGSGIFGNYTF